MVSRFAGKRGGVFIWPVWKSKAFRIPALSLGSSPGAATLIKFFHT